MFFNKLEEELIQIVSSIILNPFVWAYLILGFMWSVFAKETYSTLPEEKKKSFNIVRRVVRISYLVILLVLFATSGLIMRSVISHM